MTESNTPSNDRDVDVIGATAPTDGTNTIKDPDDWVTGDEAMTGAQRSYLETLAREAGETLPADLTKAEASEHIDRLQSVTGRGERPSQSQGQGQPDGDIASARRPAGRLTGCIVDAWAVLPRRLDPVSRPVSWRAPAGRADAVARRR